MWTGISKLDDHIQIVHDEHRDPTPHRPVATSNDGVKIGHCLSVYWYEEDEWFSCVVKNQAPDVCKTTASQCRYDDGTDYWHNMNNTVHKSIQPTEERISRICKENILTALENEGVHYPDSTRKVKLVQVLTKLRSKQFVTLQSSTTVPRKRNISEISTPTTSTVVERAKFGMSHKQRNVLRKRKLADTQSVSKTHQNDPQTQPPSTKRSTSQVVHDIVNHGHAYHTLATRGDRQSDRQFERDGYNLITFSGKDLHNWGSQHSWSSGDSDMACLPKAVSTVYDTTGWRCINIYSDGDGIVMLRPPAPIPTRGHGARKRRKKFVWTLVMSRWFYKHTNGLAAKSIPFVALAEEADDKWGYLSPQHVGPHQCVCIYTPPA